MQHDDITTDTLLLHAAGLTGPNRSTAIEAHLRECAACAAVVDQARLVADLLREQASLLAEPPAHVTVRAERLFTQVRPDLTGAAPSGQRHDVWGAAPHETSLHGVRRILANVTFDSLGSSAFAGLRAVTSGPRHLAYQSELGDLDLQITPPLRPSAADASWQLMGQLELRDPSLERTAITFQQGDLPVLDDLRETARDHRVSVDVDASGYFTVELHSGTWSASMEMEQAVLVFPGFTL